MTKSEKADTAERYYSHRKKPLLQDLRVTYSTRLYSGPDLYGLCSVGNIDEMGGMRSNLVGEESQLAVSMAVDVTASGSRPMARSSERGTEATGRLLTSSATTSFSRRTVLQEVMCHTDLYSLFRTASRLHNRQCSHCLRSHSR